MVLIIHGSTGTGGWLPYEETYPPHDREHEAMCARINHMRRWDACKDQWDEAVEEQPALAGEAARVLPSKLRARKDPSGYAYYLGTDGDGYYGCCIYQARMNLMNKVNGMSPSANVRVA